MASEDERRIAWLPRPAPRLLLLLFVLLYLPFLHLHGWRLVWPWAPCTDLPSFHTAAVATFAEGRSPYDERVWSEAEEDLGQRVFPYLYPPPSLVLFAPLAAMPFSVARVVVLALNHLLFLLLIYVLLFRLLRPPIGSAFSFVLLACVLVFDPIVVTLEHGQVNLLVVNLLCLAWIAQREGKHPVVTALPLAAAILIKTYPALLLLPLLVHRRYRTVAWTAGLATAATVVAIPLLPAEVWGDWLGTVAPTGAYGTVPWCSISPAAPWNQSLNGFVARLFLENEFSPVLVDSPRLARIVPYLAAIAVLSASAWAAAGRGLAGAPRERIDLTWSLFLLALALVAPLTWLHHLVLVLPAALVALRLALEQHRSPLPAVVVGLALAVLAWALPVWSPQLQHGPLVLGISVKLYAILALWGYLLWRARAGA